jgi:hypothetical protein
MRPRDMLSQVDYFGQVRVKPGFRDYSSERFFMHARRTRRYDYSIELVGFDVILNQLLTGFRTHVSVMFDRHNVWQTFSMLSHFFDIDDARNV